MPVRPQLRALASTRARRPKKFAAKRGQGFFCAGESSEPSALNLLLTYCTTQPAAPMGSCRVVRYLSPIALCRQSRAT